jgi:hypothetical protein
MIEREEKRKGHSPFDYSKSIMNSHTQLELGDGYINYLVNRSVAHHRDNIFICQMINERQVASEEHYAFLFNQVAKYRRPFEKWVSAKNTSESFVDLELITKYYQCSIEVAREYLALYTPEELRKLRLAYGGTEGRETEPTGEGEA